MFTFPIFLVEFSVPTSVTVGSDSNHKRSPLYANRAVEDACAGVFRPLDIHKLFIQWQKLSTHLSDSLLITLNFTHPSPGYCTDAVSSCSVILLTSQSSVNVIVLRVFTSVILPVGLFASLEVVPQSLIRTVFTVQRWGYLAERQTALCRICWYIVDIYFMLFCHN